MSPCVNIRTGAPINCFRWTPAGLPSIELVEPDYVLLDTVDLGGIPVTHLTTKSPYQDGYTLLDSVLEPKHIFLEYLIESDTVQERLDKRREIVQAFNPKLGEGILTWTQEDGSEYFIRCISDGSPSFPPGTETKYTLVVQLSLVAYDPYWYSTVEHTVYLTPAPATFFPFGFDPTVTDGFSLGQNSDTVLCCNSGTQPSPVTIIINGEIDDPVLTNTATLEDMTLKITMSAGDIFKITTGFGNKTATYTPIGTGVAVNGFQYIDPESVFWMLIPGDNIIEMANDSVGAATVIEIRWNDKYVGV